MPIYDLPKQWNINIRVDEILSMSSMVTLQQHESICYLPTRAGTGQSRPRHLVLKILWPLLLLLLRFVLLVLPTGRGPGPLFLQVSHE